MRVLSIYIAEAAGKPMQRVKKATLVAGRGIVGDRYEEGTGAWSKVRPGTVRSLSLISAEAISQANRGLDDPFLPEETRRNVLVSIGIDALNDLLGKEFTIGGVRVRGAELCDPCQRPSKLAGKSGFAEAFDGMGGLRVEVLNDGDIAEQDPISIAA